MTTEHKNRIIDLFQQSSFTNDAFYMHKVFNKRRIILYGAGECCHWFVEIAIKIHGYMPIAILDRNFNTNQTYEGIPAFSPSDYKPTDDDKNNALVIICVGKTEYHNEIITTLKKLGFKNIMFLMDVYEIHNQFNLPEILNKKGFSYFLEEKKQIISGCELFSDNESLEIYTRSLETHMRRKPVALPMQPKEEQYFPKDITLSQGYTRFINCGSYDGDTIRLLNKHHGKIDELICFEPEPQIFIRLTEYLTKHKNDLAKRIISLPCAAYNNETCMPFVSSSGLGSRIAENGDSFVQCVAIDHIVPGFSPTFICMDVEGAEPEVLKGAEKTIKDSRPDLAICVYHAPNHLWEIPLYLNNLNLGYRFYLRNYTSFTCETVLYATR